jgi:hypothetical protein
MKQDVTETNPNGPAPRVPLELSVEYKKSYARSATEGTLRNISLSGAFLDTTALELDMNDKITIEFKISGRARKINALIVWKNDAGVGVKFNHFSNRDVQIVDDLIYFVESSREKRREMIGSIFTKVS